MRKFKTLALAASAVLIVLAVVLFQASGKSRRHPNIIFLLLDTVRADHLSFYGYERETSPVLDKFMLENWNFRNTISAAPWTPASVASIFTGLYPSAHGFMPPRNEANPKVRTGSLPKSAETLAEILKANGYHTAAAVTNPWLKPHFGMKQGFESYWYLNRRDASVLNKKALKVLSKIQERGKPFFFYIHYMDPHNPYTPVPPYDQMFAKPLQAAGYSEEMQRRMSLYDGEIRYLDDRLGEFFEELKRLSFWDDSVIFVVSDHGEQFEEHGDQGHGFNLHNEELHVLFTIRAPGRKGQVENIVSLVDVFPTLLELAGIKPPENIDGRSLISQLDKVSEQSILSEVRRVQNRKSVTEPSQKRLIIEYSMEDNVALASPEQGNKGMLYYDLSKDYAGKSLLNNPAENARLKKLFDETYLRTIPHRLKSEKTEEGALDNETVNELKTLGYL